MTICEQQRLLFIVNPIAGGKSKSKIISTIESEIDTKKFLIEIAISLNKKHLKELANYAIVNNFSAIIAIGGDGTVNEIAAEVVKYKSEILIGIIPSGSGNGLAKHLRLPSNYVKACQVINKFNYSFIDVIRVNNSIALNIAGAGFEALVASEFSKSTNNRGIKNYIKLIAKLYKNYEPIKITLTLHNGKELRTNCFSISFANGSQFGNNIFIAPLANISDGLLDIVIIKRIKYYDIPKIIYQMLTKQINKSRHIITLQATSAKLQINNSLVHLDGETSSIMQPLYIRLQSKALKIITT